MVSLRKIAAHSKAWQGRLHFSGQVSLKTGGLDNYVSTEECNTFGLEKEYKTNEQNVKFNRKQGASIIQRLGSGVMFYLS